MVPIFNNQDLDYFARNITHEKNNTRTNKFNATISGVIQTNTVNKFKNTMFDLNDVYKFIDEEIERYDNNRNSVEYLENIKIVNGSPCVICNTFEEFFS